MNHLIKLSLLIFITVSAACSANSPSVTISPLTQLNQKILWVTDTHLTAANIDSFIHSVSTKACESIFITGDIADDNLIDMLTIIAKRIDKTIYFVLGNSDHAYGKKMPSIRQKLDTLMRENPKLHYLHKEPFYFQPKNLSATDKTALIGIDGYADSWNISANQRQEDLLLCEKNIRSAISNGSNRIVILTHVPPFMTDCWYKEQITTPQNAPHYSATQSGDLFLKLANEYPNVAFIVYCGHTHHSSYQAYPMTDATSKTQRKPNLHVYVGDKFFKDRNPKGTESFITYTLNQSDFLPDSFEFSRYGQTSILK